MDSEGRYIAFRINGDGVDVLLDPNVPVEGGTWKETLSGPGVLSGTVVYNSVADATAEDGRPILDEWGTLLVYEENNEIVGGGIVTRSEPDTGAIEVSGISYYAKDMPYTDSIYFIETDPLDIFRHVWVHLQSQPGGNLAIVVDDTVSDIKIGTQIENVDFVTSEGERVQFEAGPYKLNWWQTTDLAGELDKLAKENTFDYREQLRWNSDQTGLVKRIELGYPKLGTRRDNLRFAVGENIFTEPKVTRDGTLYATGVLALGSGEGRDMVHALVNREASGRLRRIATVSDKSLRSIKAATARAYEELARRLILDDVTELIVTDHANARLGSWRVGDELPIIITNDRLDIVIWVRVVALERNLDTHDEVRMTVIRTEKLT